MRILVAFYTLAALRGTLCGNLRNEDSSSCSLDLSKPDATFVEVHNSVDSQGINKVECSPKSGHSIMTIVDNGEAIWDAKDKEECTLALASSKGGVDLLALHLKEDEKYSFLYYAKDGEHTGHNGPGWKSITEDEFNAKFAKMNEAAEGVAKEATKDAPDSTTDSEHADGHHSSDGSPEPISFHSDPSSIPSFQNGSPSSSHSDHSFHPEAVHGEASYLPEYKILDLLMPNLLYTNVNTSEDKGVKHTRYSMVEGHGVTRIVEGGKRILEAPSSDKWYTVVDSYEKDESIILAVGRYVDGMVETVHFAKSGDKWNDIPPQLFNRKYDAMNRNASASEYIDLSKPDSFPCSSFKFSFDDIPITSMLLWAEDLRITRLLDGDETVAELPGSGLRALDNGGFPWVAFHVNAGQKPDLVIVPANEGMVTLFKKDEGVWRKCQHIGEADAFKVPVDEKRDFTLDIAKRLEDYRFQILGANVQDLSIHSYHPRHGYYAMEVVYDTAKVWKSENGDYCTYAEVFGSDSCMLIISTEGGQKFSIRHFENTSFGWMATPKKDFVINKWNGPNGVRTNGQMNGHNGDQNVSA